MAHASPRRARLADFAPDGKRARFLHARLAKKLGASIAAIARACDGRVDAPTGDVLALCRAIEAEGAVDVAVYALYFDLLAAARARDAEALARHFAALLDRSLPAPAFHAVAWGSPDLPPALARRYLHYVNVEPASRIAFRTPTPEVLARARTAADAALALLAAHAPEVGDEVRELVRQLVLVSDDAGASGMQFDGATSFFLWGALFLNADRHQDVVDMVDGLAHESAHAHLFGVSLGESLVRNPPEERHGSPLRRDPRPLDGIYHATYVSARMHYAHHRLLEAGAFAGPERAASEAARETGRRAFLDGLATLDAHARPTALGRDLMRAARAYMAPFH